MEEEQNIKQNPNSEIKNPNEDVVNDESQIVNRETLNANEEIINPKSEIQKSETENMEVHHHPDLHHRKKHWKEYFLEFIMIFLAVTLGFFAESYREHLSDRSKEKEYMHSLLADLKSDTAIINRTISYNKFIYTEDSLLLRLLQIPNKNSLTLDSIYKLYPNTEDFEIEINDPKTFEQLESTGDSRLIRKKIILDSMSNYYEQVSKEKFFRDELQSQLQLTYNFSHKIFDLYSFDTKVKKEISLISNDPQLIKEYSNKLYLMVRDYQGYDLHLEALKNKAIHFISLIQKEYHFEND